MTLPKPLRLLVAGCAWPPETFLARLVRGLVEAGIQVTVASRVKPTPEWLALGGFRWLPAPGWSGGAPGRVLRLGWMAGRALIRAPRDVARLAKNMRDHEALSERVKAWSRLLSFTGGKWDAIYFPWNTAAISYLPLFSLGAPVVVSCRGSQVNVAPHHPHRGALRQGLKATFRRAAAVHCVSEAIRQEARRHGLDLEKAHVIRPAVDPEFFRPGPDAAGNGRRFRVVSTGSLSWTKGYEYALSAIRRLRDAGVDVEYRVIGSGQDHQRLLYTIQDLGLSGHVHLMGRLSPEEVLSELRAADVFLLSSVSEGISNAALEAMACGLPIVTADCGGMREAVTDGLEGFVVPAREPAPMAAALARLSADPPLRRRMGTAARDRILKDFSLRDQIRRFVRLYEGVIQNCRA